VPSAGQPGTPSTAAAAPQTQGQGQVSAAPGGNAAGPGVAAGAPRGGGGDLQQMLSRLPASPLNDFQKGDAVMVVATSGQGDRPSTVITMLGGVEPILQASSSGAASILSPWSLSPGGGGDMGTP
jgi:hypothetical protein